MKTIDAGDGLRLAPQPDDEPLNALAHQWTVPVEIGANEWHVAKLSPVCVVENYLFADVACQFAPGSTGKTTASLYEAVHVVLGRDLWGLHVYKPGPVLYVTAEDRREFLVGRLREICAALELSDADIAKVRDGIRIDDCTKHPRRLTVVAQDVVVGSGFAESIVSACLTARFAPVLVQFDPLVSFGVGESRVNDGEQGLIEAARVIVGGLDCCVRYVHHTGQGPARAKSVDQYSNRGGSALPDGARMVTVMQPMTAEEWHRATGDTLDEGESAFLLARPKLSYAPPQPDLYISRRGYRFQRFAKAAPIGEQAQRGIDALQVLALLGSEIGLGLQHTRNTLEDVKPENLPRHRFRAGLATLLADGRVGFEKPATAKQGGAREFLVVFFGSPRPAGMGGEPS